ncbi:MAG: asparaginase domain-containing protein [Clostridiales Family XIII bacterium]|jgi:L-asparaginase|nr:asparaginase domain-containing protein [Clostridiales Family XIII bacterium]
MPTERGFLHIHAVHTGGTIASGKGADGTLDLTGAPSAFLRADGVSFTHSSPYGILSENLRPAHWDALVTHLRDLPLKVPAATPESLDALVITHGSDTLSYTAAMLGLLCAGLRLPIFLLASNRPLSDPHANAAANFAALLRALRAGVAPGVYVPWRNPGEKEACLFRAEEISQPADGSAAFACLRLGGPARVGGSVPSESLSCPTLYTAPSLKASILVIRPYPGLDYETIDLTRPDAVLHGLYHSFTADTEGVLHFAERAARVGKKVHLAPLPAKTQGMYAGMAELLRSGRIVPMRGMTLETAYASLLLQYSGKSQTEAKK